ncbi:MAG TPA: TadE/TadG family type IV pilus assembly protein [Pseudolabrys sp.]|nr:TadE/TadG family type IV pilus assembly protein [Pseudolabrys sp.]
MRGLKLLGRFARKDDGVAAIEFAVIAPFLLLTMLSTYDIGRAFAVHIKVRTAAATLATITNQYTTGTNNIDATDMTSIVGATAAILSPFPTNVVVTKITQIKMTSASNAVVSWSYATQGNAYATGASWSTLPAQFKSTKPCNSFPCYLIYAEVSYTYTPLFGAAITGPINLTDNQYATPRSSACVQYLSTPSSC